MTNLLDVLPEYVLYWMVQKGKERRLDAGEDLLKEGENCRSLFLVLDGIFSVISGVGNKKILGQHAPGSVVGEVPFFTGVPVPVTIVAKEPSLVLELSREILGDKLDHDHEYAADLYKALLISVSDHLRETTARLYALEEAGAHDLMHDPAARKAQEAIDAFKAMMVQLDKEAIKNGSTSEEAAHRFFEESSRLMVVCHDVLGTSSPLSDVVKQQLGSRLQHEMLPYVLTTETADRFYSKPRGYAGDYLAIHRIYRNEAGGTGRVGPLVDRMFLETPPSKAVRNRRTLLAGEIIETVKSKAEGPVNVLCMASGPATEVFDAFAALEDKSRLRVTLMDIDLQALAFVDEVRSKHKLGNQINLVNENLIALYLGRGKTKVEPQDLIYSIGLVDYLNDKLVTKLLKYVYDNLATGGRVILGNFHPKNPAKEFMDYVLEWNLIHRTEEDMNRLFLNSAFKRPSTKIQFEAEGVNLFAECVKA